MTLSNRLTILGFIAAVGAACTSRGSTRDAGAVETVAVPMETPVGQLTPPQVAALCRSEPAPLPEAEQRLATCRAEAASKILLGPCRELEAMRASCRRDVEACVADASAGPPDPDLDCPTLVAMTPTCTGKELVACWDEPARLSRELARRDVCAELSLADEARGLGWLALGPSCSCGAD